MSDEVGRDPAASLGSIAVWRIPVWIIATCIGAYFIGGTTLDFSRQIVERGWDRSAMAWTIALPFMIPAWLFQSGCVVVPVALIYEVAAWMTSRSHGKTD